jgi:hypothetical protein
VSADRCFYGKAKAGRGNLGRVRTVYNVGTELNVPNALSRKPNRRTLHILNLNDSAPAFELERFRACHESPKKKKLASMARYRF